MDEMASQDANRSEGSAPPATSALSFDPRDLIPTPIFCATPDGRLVWMNAAAEQLTGQLAPAISGQPFTSLFPEEGRRSIARRFIRNRRKNVTDFYVEAPITTKDDAHWVGMHVRLATAANGKSAYLCSAHDLQRIHSELEGLRRDVRTSEARLAEASAGSELKSAYLASMSHELRAPMNGVIGMSRLLLDSGLDRDQRTFAEVIQESGQHLLELVDDILDYSRIEAGQLEIARMDFDVRVTVDAVAALLADSTHRKGVTFSSWVHHRVPSRLTGDPARVRQVLLDLANHALREAEGGELSLRVELVEESAHQAVVRFWVNRAYASQNAEDDVTAFAAFGDVEGATPVGNVGARTLGLSISKRIVHLMGGDSGVVAVPGLGARLWFRVPLGKQEDVAQVAQETTPDTGLSGLRVLVADGNEGARHELSRRLSALGCVCDEAEGGLDALQRLKNNAAGGRAYSVAFVDLDLPELSAESLASSVRNDLALSSTALLMTTSVGRPGDAARAASWGYDAYFVSPIDEDQLSGAIAESIASRRAPGSALVTRFTIAEKRRSRVRVLVVESNPIDQLVVLSALRRVGYAPEAVTNGDDALAACEKSPFDVVFVDLGATVDAGIELVGTLRGVESPRRTPVIALTGRMRDEEKERCTQSGFDDFLPKPIDLELLCATVDRWTRPAPAVTETPAAVEEAQPEPAPMPELEIERAPTWSAPASVETAPEVTPVVDVEPTEPGPETAPEETPAPAPDITEAWVADGSWEAVPVLDATRIETSSMGNPELRTMLMEAFLARTQQPLARLRLAHGSGDATQVEIQAHALAGLCSAIGASRAAALFETIASGATAERMAAIEPLVARSEREVKLAMDSAEPRAEAA
jgi:PAS domain S-box-containing protein